MMKVESIQYQAALEVTVAWQGSIRVRLYEELGWESLSDRRMSRRVLQIHKIVDNKTPLYLKETLPPDRRQLLNLPYIFHEFTCRTSSFSLSFLPDGIKSWNNILSNFDFFPTFNQLKSHIYSLIRPNSKPTFNIHNPSNLRYIYQLRVGLTKLRSNKKSSF